MPDVSTKIQGIIARLEGEFLEHKQEGVKGWDLLKEMQYDHINMQCKQRKRLIVRLTLDMLVYMQNACLV